MAVVNLKGTAVTNADNKVLNNSRVFRTLLEEAVGTVELANGDSIGSTYRLCRLPSNARISRVLLSCDAITSGAGDVGVYKTYRDGGTVVDVDFFASAQSIATALVHSDVSHEADPADAGAGWGHADVEKPLWQALGLTADPYLEYDITLTLTAATTEAGTVSMKVQFGI